MFWRAWASYIILYLICTIEAVGDSSSPPPFHLLFFRMDSAENQWSEDDVRFMNAALDQVIARARRRSESCSWPLICAQLLHSSQARQALVDHEVPVG